MGILASHFAQVIGLFKSFTFFKHFLPTRNDATASVKQSDTRFSDPPDRKTLVSFIIITILIQFVNWLVAIGTIWEHFDNDVENWSRTARDTSLTMSAYIDKSLTVNKLILDEVETWTREETLQTEEDFIKAMSQESFYELLRFRFGSLEQVDVVGIISRNGTVIQSSRSLPPPNINVSDRQYFQDQMRPDRPKLSIDVVTDRISGKPSLYLARQLKSVSGDILGLAVVGIKVSYLSDFFSKVANAPDIRLGLFANNGKVLFSNSEDALPERLSYDGIDPIRRVGNGRSAILEGSCPIAPSRTEDNIVAPKTLDGFQAYFVVCISDNLFLADWLHARRHILLVASILSIVALLVSWKLYSLSILAKRAERAETERQWLTALVNTPSAIACIVDYRGTVLFSNSSFKRIVSPVLEEDNLLRSHCLLGRKEISAFLLAENNSTSDINIVVTNPGKDNISIHFLASRLTLPRFDTCVVLVGYDQTLRLLALAAIAQSSKMITLGEMATSVAHELNQPLNVIKMATQSILIEFEAAGHGAAAACGDATEKETLLEYAASKLRRIEEQTERAALLIDHMRIFGRAPTDPATVFDARAACVGALQIIGEQIRLAGIRIVETFSVDPIHVKGHQILLEQVFLNLFSNARDALMESKTSLPEISISSRYQEGRVQLCISDNAPGISLAVRSRVFDPFFTTKPIGEGTGLGLAISYGIIRDMGGTLGLAPDDHPTTFVIDLPLA